MYLSWKVLLFRISAGLLILAVAVCLCCSVGTSRITLSDVFSGDQNARMIFWEVRLPRVMLAVLVGAALSCAGAAFQALLRNPLADPYILGISSGAGLGAMIAVISGISFSLWWGSPIAIFAFIGAAITVCLVWMIGSAAGRGNTTSLLLSGVVINAFFSAIILFLTSIATSRELQSTVFWLMGNLGNSYISTEFFWISAVVIMSGIFLLYLLAPKMNIISVDEDDAKSIGINVSLVQMQIFIVSALITAVAVSLSGLIGFIGLIVPHALRVVFGPDHRQLIPLSAISGAVFLAAADTVARVIVSPSELPVGVITAIAGGPFFLFLLIRYSHKVGWIGR